MKKLTGILLLLLVVLMAALPALAETAVSPEEAATVMRGHLVAREETFTLLVSGKVDEAGAQAIYEQAVAHNGVPNEGDYLRSHIVDCVPVLTQTKVNGKVCTKIEYAPLYKDDAEKAQAAETAVAEFFAKYAVKEMASDYEKVRAIYDYLCDTVIYDYERKHGTQLYWGEREQKDILIANTAYAALVEGNAVCEGYASAFYRLALEAGVDARVVSGFAGEEHAWNIVKLDDLYYHLDATWDASYIYEYGYFLRPVLDMHTSEDAFLNTYPMAQSDYPVPELPVYQCGDYSYTVTYGAHITACNSEEENIVVPQELNGVPVVSIQREAFSFMSTPNMKAITLPEGVHHLRYMGIYAISRLEEINAPSTLAWSRDEWIPFLGCDGVSHVNIAEGNPYIQNVDEVIYSRDGAVVLWCPVSFAADTYVVAEGTKIIGAEAFRGCRNIRKIVLPETVEEINNSAFMQCYGLEEINIPGGCVKLCTSAFQDTALKKIHLPASLEYVGGGVFGRCAQLEEITMDEGCKNYCVWHDSLYHIIYMNDENGTETLYGMELLAYPAARAATHYDVPEGTIYICGQALSSSQLETVTLPEGLILVDGQSFMNCENLKEITLPKSVEAIWDAAFEGCVSLESITILHENPDISENSFGWFTPGVKEPSFILRGIAGSRVEEYAKQYGFSFEAVSPEEIK